MGNASSALPRAALPGDLFSLDGCRLLITGGSRGIGAACAELAVRQGAQVVIGYRSRHHDAAEVVERCRAFGGTATAHAADVATAAGAEALVAAAVAALGGVDAVVVNAGIWPPEDVAVAVMDDDRWDRTMRENLDAMFYTARAAARALADGGRMVLVASTAGQRGEAFHADYAASKGAMISFTKSLAIELAPRGITVNSVAPGWVDTDMAAPALGGEARERIAAAIPMGRIATPADIAAPILFLCTPGARHITGEIVNVNGGSVMCG